MTFEEKLELFLNSNFTREEVAGMYITCSTREIELKKKLASIKEILKGYHGEIFDEIRRKINEL